jgi:hypothetical protein
MRRGLGKPSGVLLRSSGSHVVDYVGRQGCHHLELPQQFVPLGVLQGNCKTRHHVYSSDYYSSFAITRTLIKARNPQAKILNLNLIN